MLLFLLFITFSCYYIIINLYVNIIVLTFIIEQREFRRLSFHLAQLPHQSVSTEDEGVASMPGSSREDMDEDDSTGPAPLLLHLSPGGQRKTTHFLNEERKFVDGSDLVNNTDILNEDSNVICIDEAYSCPSPSRQLNDGVTKRADCKMDKSWFVKRCRQFNITKQSKKSIMRTKDVAHSLYETNPLISEQTVSQKHESKPTIHLSQGNLNSKHNHQIFSPLVLLPKRKSNTPALRGSAACSFHAIPESSFDLSPKKNDFPLAPSDFLFGNGAPTADVGDFGAEAEQDAKSSQDDNECCDECGYTDMYHDGLSSCSRDNHEVFADSSGSDINELKCLALPNNSKTNFTKFNCEVLIHSPHRSNIKIKSNADHVYHNDESLGKVISTSSRVPIFSVLQKSSNLDKRNAHGCLCSPLVTPSASVESLFNTDSTCTTVVTSPCEDGTSSFQLLNFKAEQDNEEIKCVDVYHSTSKGIESDTGITQEA